MKIPITGVSKLWVINMTRCSKRTGVLCRVAQWSATLIPYCPKTWVTYLASTCWKTGLSVPISNLFYGCYELVMQILSRLMMHTEETEAQLAL